METCKSVVRKLRGINTIGFCVFLVLFFAFSCTTKESITITPKCPFIYVDYGYNDVLTPQDRFLSIGFADFRESDFSLIQPLFNQFGAKATFLKINRIHSVPYAQADDIKKVVVTLQAGHELGDHTFEHNLYLINSPLWDGVSFPANSDMRNDDKERPGYNVFGYRLDDRVSNSLSLDINTPWCNLSDEECQRIRGAFSVFKSTKLLSLYDMLSNRYLGTSGSSDDPDSWNGECYTKGIFTDCKTSANHEIWERVVKATVAYYKDQFGVDLVTWGSPGSPNGNLFYSDYMTNKVFYDPQKQVLVNDAGRFASSYLIGSDGESKLRSFIDVLRENAIKVSHTSVWPSKLDGTQRVAMKESLFFNESLSRKDALLYATDLSVINYLSPSNAYSGVFFKGNKSRGSQMFDDKTVSGRPFRTYVEYIRHCTARGGIAGGAFDSIDDDSSYHFFEELLKWCNVEKIRVIPKATAFDIAFNHDMTSGNLIRNPLFYNSAVHYFKDSEDLPTNPDGFTGECHVSTENDDLPVLHTDGMVNYIVFGVPYGVLRFSVEVKGEGTIRINGIKNNSFVNYHDGLPSYEEGLENFCLVSCNSLSSYERKEASFSVDNNPLTEYEQVCEGWGEKIMGLQIAFSANLHIKSISLVKE